MKILTTITLLLIIAFRVEALDYKTFNGSMCKAINGTEETLLNRAYSQLTNSSPTQYIDVFCPIIKDVTTQDTVDYARIILRTPNGNTTCTTIGIKQVGANYPNNPTVIGQSSNIQERVLSDVDATSAISAYGIMCTLAPKAEILNYKFGE